jgi:pseudouridine synthase
VKDQPYIPATTILEALHRTLRFHTTAFTHTVHEMISQQVVILIFLVFCFPEVDSLTSRDSSSRQRPSKGKVPRSLPPERSVVILYNKPPNVVTSHVSEDSRPTVYDEIQSMRGFVQAKNYTTIHDVPSPFTFEEVTGIRSKLHAIGRLDADTSGLLLLTNDGALVHHVTNPKALQHHKPNGASITKTYEALIMGHHTDESLVAVRNGVDIGKKYGGMTQPVHELKILSHPNHKSTLISITISEGKNRQVRRMFHAVGSGVMKLRRTLIGDDLSLQDVDEGQWRLLTDDEVQKALNWQPRIISQEIPLLRDKKEVYSHVDVRNQT